MRAIELLERKKKIERLLSYCYPKFLEEMKKWGNGAIRLEHYEEGGNYRYNLLDEIQLISPDFVKDLCLKIKKELVIYLKELEKELDNLEIFNKNDFDLKKLPPCGVGERGKNEKT